MDENTSTLPPLTHGWTIKRVRNITKRKFRKRPCWYQVKTALAIYEGKDVVLQELHQAIICCILSLCSTRASRIFSRLLKMLSTAGCSWPPPLVRSSSTTSPIVTPSWSSASRMRDIGFKFERWSDIICRRQTGCCDILWHDTFWGNGAWLPRSPNPKFASRSIASWSP